jgi:type III secretory pathway component EscU
MFWIILKLLNLLLNLLGSNVAFLLFLAFPFNFALQSFINEILDTFTEHFLLIHLPLILTSISALIFDGHELVLGADNLGLILVRISYVRGSSAINSI